MGKTKSKKHAENKKVLKSSYSGRIANGREIILVDEAEEYLKKMGCKVIKPIQKIAVYVYIFSFLLIGLSIILK